MLFVVKKDSELDKITGKYPPEDCYQVYDIKTDKNNYIYFLIFENHEWIYSSAKKYKPISAV